jgi:ubiquitin-protein ligase
VLGAILNLLATPKVDDALVPEIADLYTNDRDAYCNKAREWTSLYGT